MKWFSKFRDIEHQYVREKIERLSSFVLLFTFYQYYDEIPYNYYIDSVLYNDFRSHKSSTKFRDETRGNMGKLMVCVGH